MLIFTSRDNMVDYANEVECFYMFRFFDKNQDGYLDFEEYFSYSFHFLSFLQMTLPNNDV